MSPDPGKWIRVAAGVLIRNGRVLIARRSDDDPLSGTWEFPGGKVEAGETPEEALRRELKEEFDIAVRVGEHLGTCPWRYPHIAIQLMAYRVFWEGGRMAARAHAEVRWVPLDRLFEYRLSSADRAFAEALQTRSR